MLYLWLILLGFTLVLAPLCAADVFEEAEWLRDPGFEGAAILDLYHKADVKGPEPEGPQNVHTYFRKEIELPGEVIQATLFITGDDYYKFYINGEFAVQGPEPAYPFMHPYYRLDVTRFLEKGTNCLAAHAYYQGLVNRVWNSADNRAGFMLALDVVFADGSTRRYVTDGGWRCLTSEAFPTDRTIGYKTQFAEDIVMAAIPEGWRETGFDDSGWAEPLTGRQDHVLVEQMTPPLELWRAEPAEAVDKGDGNWFYDFGTELVGCTRIRLRGKAGHRLEVRHGEELSAPQTVRYDMRANCTYQEFPTLEDGENTIEFYDYRGFRYIEILDAPSEPEVWVDVRHHPFDEQAAQFESSHQLLNGIWQLCKNGVRFGSQGVFVDCPTREKGQYLGDTLIIARSHLTLTGDPTLARKALADFQASQHICPGIMAVAPGSFMQEFAEYSLHWPMLLRIYYERTGERAFAERMMDAAFDDFFAYFSQHENEDGLLIGGAGKPILVDWPPNLRDDYDYEYAKERENTVVNAFYYASLSAAAELARLCGRDATELDGKARRVRDAFDRYFYDEEKGLYVDAPGSGHSSLHANALPLAFGLVPRERWDAVVDLVRDKRLNCGVYIAPFVIEAMWRAGEGELAFDLLTSKDEHSWHEMLKHGATTCMEAWGPEQKWNTSWCHAWSSGPTYLISEYVMGLTPAEPGWGKVRFAPHLPPDTASARLSLRVPLGTIEAVYGGDDGWRLTVPAGVEVIEAVPRDVPVEVAETQAARGGTLTAAQQALLAAEGWGQRVGPDAEGIWVSVDDQMLRLISGGNIVWQAPCSTAAAGTGSLMDSYKTPLGWHSVAAKHGAGAALGQVFRGREATEERWTPGMDTKEDLVLTRILHLAGEEEGQNKSGDVDSFDRCIYIHGTNDEDVIGRPVSHGCVRLRNVDVVELFERTPSGTPVLITLEREGT